MAVIINDFEEYENKYKRIINCIEFDEETIKDSGVSVYGTTLEHPLMFNDKFKSIGNILYINKTYYEFNKEDMDKLIIDTLKNTTKTNIRLDSFDLINDKFLYAIAQNKRISTVKLDPMKKLSKSQIDILLSSDIKELACSVDFNNNFEFLYEYVPKLSISNYPRVGGVNINSFVNNGVYLRIKEPLTLEQLIQLQKLFEKYPQEKVLIDFVDNSEIKEIIGVIKSKKIIIKDKREYTEADYEQFENLSDNISIEIGYNASVKPIYAKEREIILNGIIDEVQKQELSPLEKYMYLYNVVKLFKEYKKEDEKEENKLISRHSAFTLFNEYIVCAGYAELLCELVDRLNEPNLNVCGYSCTILDKVKNEEIGHRKCLVKIKDDKYGIDGTYISDPTWDHVIYHRKYLNNEGSIETDYTVSWSYKDFYNHFLMTKEEVVDENTKYVYPDVTDILFSDASAFSEEMLEKYEFLRSLAHDVIEKLNPNKKMSLDEMNIEINNISQPFISGETIISAISSLYSKIFYGTDEQIQNLVQQTININNEIHNSRFNKTSDKFNTESIKKH